MKNIILENFKRLIVEKWAPDQHWGQAVGRNWGQTPMGGGATDTPLTPVSLLLFVEQVELIILMKDSSKIVCKIFIIEKLLKSLSPGE